MERDQQDDFLIFADDEQDGGIECPHVKETWKIIIVDDEQEVHNVTKLVL